jgi:probable rRNA maturation factor
MNRPEARIEVLNIQKQKSLRLGGLRKIVVKVLASLKRPRAEVSFVFCDDRFISRLNIKHFSRRGPTDVIAFPLSGSKKGVYLGEVVVSVEQAARRAAEYGNTWQRELALYVIHGILHLLGYDDTTLSGRRRMEKKQEFILSKIMTNDKYSNDETKHLLCPD